MRLHGYGYPLDSLMKNPLLKPINGMYFYIDEQHEPYHYFGFYLFAADLTTLNSITDASVGTMLYGFLECIGQTNDYGKINGFKVTFASAYRGYGPLLYDFVAMTVPAALYPSDARSPEARSLWKRQQKSAILDYHSRWPRLNSSEFIERYGVTPQSLICPIEINQRILSRWNMVGTQPALEAHVYKDKVARLPSEMPESINPVRLSSRLIKPSWGQDGLSPGEASAEAPLEGEAYAILPVAIGFTVSGYRPGDPRSSKILNNPAENKRIDQQSAVANAYWMEAHKLAEKMAGIYKRRYYDRSFRDDLAGDVYEAVLTASKKFNFDKTPKDGKIASSWENYLRSVGHGAAATSSKKYNTAEKMEKSLQAPIGGSDGDEGDLELSDVVADEAASKSKYSDTEEKDLKMAYLLNTASSMSNTHLTLIKWRIKLGSVTQAAKKMNISLTTAKRLNKEIETKAIEELSRTNKKIVK